MTAGNPTPRPLATNRPWITVAGCLGGGLATAIAILIVAALLVLLFFFPQLVGLGGAGGPTTQARFLSALGELAEQPALRIATREIAVEVEVAVPTKLQWRPWVIPVGEGLDVEVGRTTATIRSSGNVAQYVVPLQKGEWEVRIEADEVIVTLPPPIVDRSVVEVQSDPAKIEVAVDRDWAAHLLRTDEARDAALAAIRQAVIDQASSSVAMFEVREKSRAVVAEMILALIDTKDRPARVRVRWSDEVEVPRLN
jgi:hypothetical protein